MQDKTLPIWTLPTWAEQNIALRKARDEMDRAKKIEQQQANQRQHHQQSLKPYTGQAIELPPGFEGPTLDDIRSGLEACRIKAPRDTRPKRCVAGL